MKGCEVYFLARFSWTLPLSDRKVPNYNSMSAGRGFNPEAYIQLINVPTNAGVSLRTNQNLLPNMESLIHTTVALVL